MSQLEILGISYRFPDGTTALRDITLRIDEGEFVIISGKNGSGKTVLLRILNGLIKPSSGTVNINGISVVENPFEARRELGLVFQQSDSQIVGQTVTEDIAFGLENIGMNADEVKIRVRQTLEKAGLEDHASQRPRTLSGGEKRRLTIAGVAAMSPHIIALDEPFSNLDYPGVIQVLEQLVKLNEQGHTILLVTHDLDKVLSHATRLVLIEKGSLIANGNPFDALTYAQKCGVRSPKGVTKENIGEMTWLND